ncbi:two-component regulator propeller domain-containing protein [Cesiribacter sp. SM1]|uniref:hybrid sensor histidine kinase/response regulator n=1 Tax=Cesiribacter sp. SM1 TaxID=2861196 RepID=UPI001CD6848E|nr:two-component regulator propeller domain-containing protein [Cesiribacter sp. SM1]
MKYKSVWLVAVLLFIGEALSAQSYYFRNYQVESGLSHNSGICTMQDKQGFLWFGTKDGLNRFDGHTFKVFRNNTNDTSSIGSNFIQALYESGGKLWVGTDKGLYQYDEKTEKFSLLKITTNSYIRDITEDKAGNLWFISGFTLYRYDRSRQVLQSYETNKYFLATSLCITPDGTLWVSSTEGTLNSYNAAHDAFVSYDVFENSSPAATDWIETIYPTGQESILVGTQSQGFKLFSTRHGSYQDILTHDTDSSALFVRDFVKSSENEFWVATEAGMYIYDLEKGTLTNLKKSYNNPYSISDNAIYTLYKDQEGGIWAGTYFGGVNYYPKQYTPFEKFFPKMSENSISGNAVREICQDRWGNIWIGTEDAGLNKFNPKTGQFTNYNTSDQKRGLSHYNIHGLLAIGDELWIGTFHQGLDVMDIKTGKIIRHYGAGPQEGALKSDFVYAILKTRSGKILVSTSAGINQYNAEKDEFDPVSHFPDQFYTIMFEDSEGVLWAGTYRDGLYYYNPATRQKGFYKNEAQNASSLSNNAVNGIFEDSKHNLWITTEDGLNLFNRKEKQFRRINTEEGLPSNVTYRVLEDKDQHLWISTSKGLVWYDPATEEMIVYTKAHGLLSDQLNYGSSYMDADGSMYFGTVKGLMRFDHTKFLKNTYIPPIYLTGFQVHNQELPVNKPNSPLQNSITFTDKIVLNHKQSSFSLDFAALSYTAPGMAEYAYKMEGLDRDWTYLKTNRKVYFTQLPPGNYTFQVKASNSSGLWNEKATSLEIVILPPFWASSWAYAIYALLGISLVMLGVTYYHRVAQRKNLRRIKLLESEKEKEIYQAKIEFFTNVAHEIRTPLTLIKGPLENVLRSAVDCPDIKDSLRIMNKNTNRLLDLTNQLLDFRKTEAKGFSLNFVKVNISELVEETYYRFKPAADQKNLSYKLNLPEAPLFAFVDKEAFTKILSNLLNNALKYAESRVQLSFTPLSPADKEFVIEIRNDGHLIPYEMKQKIFEPFFRLKESENELGTGIGLSLSRSLAELHKGTLVLKQSESDLNVFVLSLPLHQENEFNLYDDQLAETNNAELHKEEPEPAGETRPNLLLVENNREMLEFIAGELSADYHILKAYNGERALELLQKESVQLIVSDVMMDGMGGFELCKQVKANIDNSHIPIILLTAKNSLQAKIEGLESGADAYIEKPFSPEHLKVQITNLLTNRTKIKEYFSSSPLVHLKSIAYSKADELFLEKLNEAIYKNIADADLNVDHLAEIMNMSRPTLYRKIKAISNLTPNELINIARLKKAAELLIEGEYKIYEIANIVGYNSQTSFGRNFLKQFGMTPSEYASAKVGVVK